MRPVIMIKKGRALKRTFIVHTRRQILRGFSRSLPGIQVLRKGWHKTMFEKVSFN